MQSPYEDKWYGDKKVKIAEEAGETRNGSPLIKLTFMDDTTEIVSQKILDSEGVLTNDMKDATALRAARMFGVTKDILEVMLSYNLRLDEINFLMQLVGTSVNKNIENSEEFLWQTKDLGGRTMDQVDRVLAESGSKPTLKDVLGQS